MNRTIFITEANGMLPSYMALTCLILNETHSKNIQINALERNRQKAEKIFIDFLGDERLRFLVHDVTMPYDYPVGIDLIIKAASQSSPKYNSNDTVGTLNANILGTHFLLEYAKKSDQELSVFSTGGIYGNSEQDDIRIREDMYGVFDPTHIRSCYFESERLEKNMCVLRISVWDPCKDYTIFHTIGPSMDIVDNRAFSDL